MLLFTHSITPRLQYIADFIGKEITGQPFQLTTEVSVARQFNGARINYSHERITADAVWIQPHTLLFENKIHPQSIDSLEWNGHKAFFHTQGDIPFDIFAAAFYLLSRYEEYLPHQKDIFGRYAHENSLAFKEGFLHKPLVNVWLNDFSQLLQARFPGFPISHSPFRFLPTYDIDEAFSYKHKSGWRMTGAVTKAMLQGNWPAVIERKKVLSGQLQDPYDSFVWMDKLHQQFNLSPRYFFLLAQKTGRYDRNILPRQKALQQLIQQVSGKYDTGIHPSWQSGDNYSLINKEKETLEQITGKKVNSSRQHFLRFTLPETFRQLIGAGIKEDFSMGYGTVNGFRASVASPFYWYDLEKDKITDLLLYPFCFMDANSFYEQKYSPDQALNEMRHYYNAVKAVNGTLITLWHNTFLGTDKKFSGWKEVYVQFVHEVCQNHTTRAATY